jgi:hypothetical protein
VSIIRWKLIQSAFDGVTNIKKQKYGVTNEGRDLNVYFISTPENLANLDLIRNNNLAAIGLSDKKTKRLVTSLCG